MHSKSIAVALVILAGPSSGAFAADTITVSSNIGPWQMIPDNSGSSGFLVNTATGELWFCKTALISGTKCDQMHQASTQQPVTPVSARP